jgi:hypothetical protein
MINQPTGGQGPGPNMVHPSSFSWLHNTTIRQETTNKVQPGSVVHVLHLSLIYPTQQLDRKWQTRSRVHGASFVFLWLTHHKIKQKTVSIVIQAKDGRWVAISKCVINLSNNNVSKICNANSHHRPMYKRGTGRRLVLGSLCIIFFLFFGLKNARKNHKLVNLLCQASKGWAHSLLQEQAI